MAEKNFTIESLNKSIKLLMLIILAYFIEFLIKPGYFANFGVLPREYSGLKGIFFYSFIHGDLVHLVSNSLPLFLFMFILYKKYSKIAFKIIVQGMFITGFLVWCFARKNFHIGASGLVYALAGFLIASGYYRKDGTSLIISILILLSYGYSMFLGVLPHNKYISFESHIFGALVGIYLAKKYRNSK